MGTSPDGTGRRRGVRSAARMVLGMQVLQTLARDVRIDLRGRKIAVPEQHLHDPEVRAMIQQMRGEWVCGESSFAIPALRA